MNIVVDFGNTSVKAAIFDSNNLIEYFPNFTSVELSRVINNHLDYKILISSVSNDSTHFINLIENKSRLKILDFNTKIPITNLYETPQTLGMDRIAAAVGAFTNYPNVDCLVIDAGSCITYDFLDKNGQFHGGSISPGISMRYKALQHFTAKLPLLDDRSFKNLIGKNTKDAINIGVLNGIVGEMEHIISEFKEKYPDICIIITGGDVSFFETTIKHSIFAFPTLVLVGLNTILNGLEA